MDEIITRATESINKILETPPCWLSELSDNEKTLLVDIPDLLRRLLKHDSSKNKWIRLFRRQLKRLINNNDSLPKGFWIELHDDILYALDEANDEQRMSSNWGSFLQRMLFEEQLEQREIQLQQIIGERKSLSELLYKHKKFFEEYLQKCISLHSKVQVHGLVEDINDLLYRVYGLKELSLSFDCRIHLKEKLKCIEIPIDCSNRSLQSFHCNIPTNDSLFEGASNDLSNFLPSISIDMHKSGKPEIIENVLRSDRWIVILGDPGSGKTTLLRWITHVFAEAAYRNEEKVNLEGSYRPLIRVPILIRIAEFVSWLNQHQTKTLIDYIGEHTWFSQRYCNDESKSILKELIYHGHALILLDGLDEIPEIGQRGEIVDLVEKFIDDYVRTPDFISVFDNIMLFSYENTIETQPLNKSGGNQIVVTGRIVGYQFHPLDQLFIRHYSLLLMNHKDANEFVKNWITQVDIGIRDVLLKEEIQLDEETAKISLKKIFRVGEAIFENRSELLVSNSSLLSLICIFIFQSSVQCHLKTRVQVYNYAVQAALCAWRKQESSILENDLINFLIDLAMYLHLKSPSGLIDAFDIEHLCCVTLKRENVSKNHTKQLEYARKLISFLECNLALVTERGLQTFGFLHLSFQEYFVAKSLVRGSSIEDVAKCILSFTTNPRFRESLLLAVGWISWKWSLDEYDQFCSLLFTQTENYIIPFGTLLFFDAINDMHRLPSNSLIFVALNNLLNDPSDTIRSFYLISSLSKLSENIIIEWMESYLKDEKYFLKFCQSFPMNRLRMIENQYILLFINNCGRSETEIRRSSLLLIKLFGKHWYQLMHLIRFLTKIYPCTFNHTISVCPTFIL